MACLSYSGLSPEGGNRPINFGLSEIVGKFFFLSKNAQFELKKTIWGEIWGKIEIF